ncbi:hypothetical protein D3C75_1060140 [compost metagenome]
MKNLITLKASIPDRRNVVLTRLPRRGKVNIKKNELISPISNLNIKNKTRVYTTSI